MTQLNGAQIMWLGHATFKVTTPQNKVILLDPWIEQNPKSPPEARQLDRVDLILVSHGHFDHINDVVPTAQKFHSQVVAIAEIATWLGSKGIENVVGMNIGGSVNVQGIIISMTQAFHSSSIDDGSGLKVYGGDPAGYVIELENGLKLYHAGDTCVFGDMQLIRELYTPDIAMLPIGDFYTMGPKGAALATRLLGVKQVIPMHYGTFPALSGTPAQLKDELRKLGLDSIEVLEMTPGQVLR
ncbi:MAG TPA: metal-dependent hydrolase [Ktedonobacteraceae bacterium]|nr:metal-dependent hydrolase [Ktedonobacteraceae bacterium]